VAATGENAINYIVRPMNLDPGSRGAEDQLHNLRAVREGTRVFSAYELGEGTRHLDHHRGRSIGDDDPVARGVLAPESSEAFC
jgi:hypothetical protein